MNLNSLRGNAINQELVRGRRLEAEVKTLHAFVDAKIFDRSP